MKLEELPQIIRKLVAVEETTAPVLTCYVNLEHGPRDCRRAFVSNPLSSTPGEELERGSASPHLRLALPGHHRRAVDRG